MARKTSLEELARKDGRYDPKAMKFVFDGLSYTLKKMASEPGHVSGKTLCEGIRRMTLEKYGRLAMLVLNYWQVKTTRDIGEIVYLLIEHKWMRAQPSDSIDDFNDVYDFKTVFKNQFRF